MAGLPPELDSIVNATLDSAINSVEEVGVPFLAFGLMDDAEGRHLKRFVSDRIEEGAAAAREWARSQGGADRITCSFDGFVPFEGKRWDAIIVEAWDHGVQAHVTIAQRYQRRGLLRKTGSPVGNPMIVG